MNCLYKRKASLQTTGTPFEIEGFHYCNHSIPQNHRVPCDFHETDSKGFALDMIGRPVKRNLLAVEMQAS